MDSERYVRVTEIFLKAVDLPFEERSRFLDESCDGEPSLRDEVESLLGHDGSLPPELDAQAVHRRLRAEAEARLVPRRPAAVPSAIGPYDILRVLGEGSQGVVYEAIQSSPHRRVALKVFKGGPLFARRELRSFDRESQALAAMSHQAIATIFDAGTSDDGHPYFSMELVHGVPIDRYARERRLGLRARLELFCRICDAVQHAHDHGIVHRDLKPTNMLVNERGQPKILDFALTRRLDAVDDGDSTLVDPGQIVGSLGYMSPEQAAGRTKEVGPPTDVYSLGVILFELLTGRRPYEIGDSFPEALATIGKSPPIRPSSINPRLRGGLESILLKALEKDLHLRYRTVGELVADLRRYLAGQRIRGQGWGLLPAWMGYPRRRPQGALAVALIMVLGALALGARVWWIEQRRTDTGVQACSIQHRLDHGPADRAVNDARRLYDRHPRVPETRLTLARALFLAGREADNTVLVNEAILVLSVALEEDESLWPARYLLAEFYDRLHNPVGPQERSRAVRESGDDARSWYLRSMATLDLTTAAAHARQALSRDPHFVPAKARLAYLCERMGDLDCALELAGSLGGDGNVLWEWFSACALCREGRYLDAIDRCEKVAAAMPAAAPRLQAASFLCVGELNQALSRYDTAIDVNRKPYYRWDHYHRATVHWMQGRYADASRDYLDFRRVMGRGTYADAKLYLLRREWAARLEDTGAGADAARLLEAAAADLREAIEAAGGESWLGRIFLCLGGDISPADLIAAARIGDAKQACEAAYYAAESSLLRGDVSSARSWWRSSVDTGLLFDPEECVPTPMTEYHLAKWRLDATPGPTNQGVGQIVR